MLANETSRASSPQEPNPSTTQTTRPDMFSKYSNDATRLKKLLLKDNDEEFDLEDFANRYYTTNSAVDVSRSASPSGQEVNSSRECNPQDDDCKRKTRITYEVHPSLLLDDFFMDLHEENSNGEETGEGEDLEALLSMLVGL